LITRWAPGGIPPWLGRNALPITRRSANTRIEKRSEGTIPMRAHVGDWLVTEGVHVDVHRRKGQIMEIHGTEGEPPYLVHWLDDGHVSLFFPGPDTHIEQELPQHLHIDDQEKEHATVG
jgi:hypothetical protein